MTTHAQTAPGSTIDLPIEHLVTAPVAYAASLNICEPGYKRLRCPLCQSQRIQICPGLEKTFVIWTRTGMLELDTETLQLRVVDQEPTDKNGLSIPMQCELGHLWFFVLDQYLDDGQAHVGLSVLLDEGHYLSLDPAAFSRAAKRDGGP